MKTKFDVGEEVLIPIVVVGIEVCEDKSVCYRCRLTLDEDRTTVFYASESSLLKSEVEVDA